MTIALGLIEQGDSYLLQLRPNKRQIGAAGLIGCFGGKKEEGESPIEAVSRELNEETTLKSSVGDFEELGEVNVISDNELQPVKIKGHLFRIAVDLKLDIKARSGHGELVILPKDEASEYLDKMTVGTRASFEQFILGEQ